ncbi:hypothetical protein GCK72_015487 [Caenorhabditis remanei]|uniref:Uncharacterized protein n=1 Tax=Caenorhabditis remanei TaxID=31234 RepID=A0A6A5GV38_CAERE|nr:hypothetical protein GCK72_015487 [Caenorhabditis remanei]KAF1759027.1 hypothetical protein GCK72_015487 [Caenorhabditis remanei]
MDSISGKIDEVVERHQMIHYSLFKDGSTSVSSVHNVPQSGQFIVKAPHNTIIQIETRRFTGRHEKHEAIQIKVEAKIFIDSALHWLRTKFFWNCIIGGAVLVAIVVFFVLAYCCSCWCFVRKGKKTNNLSDVV